LKGVEMEELPINETTVRCTCGEELSASISMAGAEALVAGLSPGEIRERLMTCPKCHKKWILIEKATEKGEVSRRVEDFEGPEQGRRF
jgi:hypothetical protein